MPAKKTKRKTTKKPVRAKKSRKAHAIPPHPVAPLPAKTKGKPTIRYTVAMDHPSSHSFSVTIALGNLPAGTVTLRMPSWTPGSYKIREFARNVSQFAVADSNGRAVAFRQTAKDTWQFTAPKDSAASVTYRVYGFELSVRTPHMDDTHAFFQPTNLLMYPEGHLDAPSVLEVVPFPGWTAHCPLPRAKSGKHTFVAASYDILADSPVEIGNHRTAAFEVDGKRHEIVVHGIGGFPMDQMARDFPRIVRAAKAHFGNTLPYENYTFILHFLPGNRGGLEHLNSQVSAWPSANCETREQYEDFLSLISHEYFHLWNVKRIRPSILGPFDYTCEQYTDQLWVMEGITTYYEWLVLARAGLVSRERVMRAFEAELARWEGRPGNSVMPLDESGRLAWTKLYLADEDFVNTGISYYLKGCLVAGLLDMGIRTRTRGRKHGLSLDDVMLRLYQDYGWPKPGFPEGRFEQVVEEVTGLDFSRQWRDWLHSTRPLPLEDWFGAVGYVIGRDPVARAGPDGVPVDVKAAPWFGWDVRTGSGCVSVTAVRTGSPAWEAGVSVKDDLIALNGLRLSSAGDLESTLRGLNPGATVELTLFRDTRLLTLSVRTEARHPGKLRLLPVPNPTRQQQETLEAWLGPRT